MLASLIISEPPDDNATVTIKISASEDRSTYLYGKLKFQSSSVVVSCGDEGGEKDKTVVLDLLTGTISFNVCWDGEVLVAKLLDGDSTYVSATIDVDPADDGMWASVEGDPAGGALKLNSWSIRRVLNTDEPADECPPCDGDSSRECYGISDCAGYRGFYAVTVEGVTNASEECDEPLETISYTCNAADGVYLLEEFYGLMQCDSNCGWLANGGFYDEVPYALGGDDYYTGLNVELVRCRGYYTWEYPSVDFVWVLSNVLFGFVWDSDIEATRAFVVFRFARVIYAGTTAIATNFGGALRYESGPLECAEMGPISCDVLTCAAASSITLTKSGVSGFGLYSECGIGTEPGDCFGACCWPDTITAEWL
jgi:hypothetical protein